MDDKKRQDVLNRITAILYDLGIPAYPKGFRYLRYGILITYSDYSEVEGRITKYLYPEIAEHFGTTDHRVERAIRHVIKTAFDRDNGKFAKYFGATTRTGATNAQVIIMLADKLLLDDGICPES